MRIQASCESCFHDFSVASTAAGKRVKCPECGEGVRVPMDDGDEEPAPRRSSGGGKRKSGQSSSGGDNTVMIGVATAGGVVVVGLLLFLALRPGPQVLPAPPNQSPAEAQAAPTATPSAVTPSTSVPNPAQPVAAATAAAAHSGAAAAPTSLVATPTAAAGSSVGTTPATGAVPTATNIASPTAASPSTATPADGATAPKKPLEKLDYEQLIALVKPAVVRINVVGKEGSSVGSGFVVDKDGTVVTNYHVITGAKKVEVEFSDGTKAKGLGYRVVNQKKDIAIIKIEMPANKVTTMPLAEAMPGEGAEVMAFGAPLGLSFTSSKGIISALRKEEEMRDQLGADVRGNWLQTDTPISPGNSGGPLVDRYGRVVGMNTMQLASGQNLNFAVSAQDIQEELKAAPEQHKEFNPEDLKEYTKSISRKLASEELGTERGRKLFAAVEEIFLLNMTNQKTVALDASGRIWTRVVLKSKGAIEKSKIELSFGEPSADAAVMFVILEMKNSRKGTAGTQELKITAQLICAEPHAKKSESPYIMVWKEEETVGTIALGALVDGNFPKQADEKLAAFFNKFRTAYLKAVREQKEADEKAKTDEEKAAAASEKKGAAK